MKKFQEPGAKEKIVSDAPVSTDALRTTMLDSTGMATPDTPLRQPDATGPAIDLAKSAAAYRDQMRDLAGRLQQLDVTGKRLPDALPALFEGLLGIRIGVLGALDAFIRPLTYGKRSGDVFKPPEQVEKGLQLANELFAQMTKVVQALLKPGPPAYAPVAGAETAQLATRLWNDLIAGDVLVYKDIANKADASTMDPKVKATVKELIRNPSHARVLDLFTRLAVLLHFRQTCQAVADVMAAAKGRWLILVCESANTLATLPGDLAIGAKPEWKGTNGWHVGLVIGQEIDSTLLVPAGRLVQMTTGLQLRSDRDENGLLLGWTLAPREVFLSHELDHIKRQLSGGWEKGYEGEPDEVKVLKDSFGIHEEYRAILDGELPLRGRLGLQPRGNGASSITIKTTMTKATLKELLTYFMSVKS